MFETYWWVILANVAVGIVATLLFEFYPQGIIQLFGNESTLYNEYAMLWAAPIADVLSIALTVPLILLEYRAMKRMGEK